MQNQSNNGFTNSKLPQLPLPKIRVSLIQNCSRKIAADIKKMRIYNWSRNDLSKYEIRSDIGKVIRRRNWSRSFSICLNEKENINIAKMLSSLRRLNTLSIDFSSGHGGNINVNNETLNLLASKLQNLKLLKCLKLNLENCKNVSKNGFVKFAFQLSKCKVLRKLILNTESCSFKDIVLISFSSTILKLKFLNDLQINLDNFSTTKAGLTTFMNTMSNSKSIKSLGVDLHLSMKYDAAALLSFSLQNLKQLQELKLDFSFCVDIGDEGVTTLSQSISQLSLLNTLELSFQKCSRITDKGISSLSEILKNFERLTKLHLLFLNCAGATEIGLKTLSKNVSCLSKLENFYLGFGHWQNISDEGFESILDNISNTPNLKELKLAFEAHSLQSEGGTLILIDNLSKFNNLLQLSVRFHSRFISDKSLQEFGHNLGKINNLTHLHVDFHCKSMITDDGVTYLSQGIAQLSHLIELEFTLVQPKRFTEQGLFILTQSLARSNQALINLKMMFYFCEGINDNSLKGLGKRLLKISKLRALKLVFFACPKLSDEGLFSLTKNIPLSQNYIKTFLDFVVCAGITEKANLFLREFRED